jgi:hypothetical protein
MINSGHFPDRQRTNKTLPKLEVDHLPNLTRSKVVKVKGAHVLFSAGEHKVGGCPGSILDRTDRLFGPKQVAGLTYSMIPRLSVIRMLSAVCSTAFSHLAAGVNHLAAGVKLR